MRAKKECTAVENQVLFVRFDGGRTDGTPLHCGFVDFCGGMVYFGHGKHNDMSSRSIIFVVLLSTVIALSGAHSICFAQDTLQQSVAAGGLRQQAVFDDVEAAISSGEVSLLTRHFGPQVEVNLRDGESGTFSANQAFYLLENFFRTRRFGKLRFSTIGESDATPYATGSAECVHDGNRQRVQVYVALTSVGKKHVITQLNIY